jgi:hypothetical protein
VRLGPILLNTVNSAPSDGLMHKTCCKRDTLCLQGNSWLVPFLDNPWDHRQPIQPSAEMDLEPVPGHYRDMLGLSF